PRTPSDRPEPRARDPRRRLDRVVQALAFDQVVSPELLLRLGEGAIGDESVAFPQAHRGGRLGRLQGVPAEEPALLLEPARVLRVLLVELSRLLLAQARQELLVVVDHEQVLHPALLSVAPTGRRRRSQEIDSTE